MPSLRSLLRRRPLAAVLVLPVGFSAGFALLKTVAATFEWKDPAQGGLTAGVWSVATNWVGGVAPVGNNPTDELIFGGPVATDNGGANPPPAYVSTNDRATFLLNRYTLQATDINGASADVPHNITGNQVTLTGTAPRIEQNGAGPIAFNHFIRFATDTALTGDGAGTVTLNNTVSGVADLTKTGTSTFRFGSQVNSTIEQPSNNSWFGRLTINGGSIRFNNNAVTGRTALRANPVTLSPGATLSVNSELRAGTLSGAGGLVQTIATGANETSKPIILHAIEDGTYGGSVQIGAPTGSGTTDGTLTVRGPGTQTLTQTEAGSFLTLSGGDMVVGTGASLVLAENASTSGESKGGVVLNGGTFRLDNTATNNGNRLRGNAADVDVTGLETTGGGTFSLVGNPAGTSEQIARLQLGSVNNLGTISTARSGALNVNVTHTAGASAATVLSLSAYTRDNITVLQDTTVDFTATDGAGAKLALGTSGNNPRIGFNGITVPLLNGALNNSGTAADVGWATVNGTDFAGHGANGIQPIPALTTVPFTTGSGSITTNYILQNSGRTFGQTGGFQAQTLKIAPGVTGMTVNTSFSSKGVVLGGTTDFTIGGTGTYAQSSFAGSLTRYFHVDEATLTVGIPFAGNGAIVKAGAGTLALTAATNATVATTINAGILRATTANLPGGALELRGGVLEISGGGTFSRNVGVNVGEVSWSGFDTIANDGVREDRGSGGFAAIGGDLTVDLGGAGVNNYAWEDGKFINSGHAIIFGSRSADSRVTWTDNLSLSATSATVNYNAREIRVLDNTGSAGDSARMSGVISGTIQNDLLKTGAGTLELTGSNTYSGATLVAQGTLLVNKLAGLGGSISASFLTDMRPGATLAGNGTTGAVRLENAASVPGASILAPGNLPGNTSLLSTGDLTFAGVNTKLSIEVGGLTVGGDGTTGYDRVNVTGGLTLNGAQLEGTLLNLFNPAPTDLLFIIVNDLADPIVGTFAQGSQVLIGSVLFDISYVANSTGNTFTGGNDVALRAVPEPTASVLLLASAAVLLRRRRPATRS